MSQNNKKKRSLHCSFCDDEGHTINNCQDPQIIFLLKEFNEIISLDIKCNFKMKYVKYILSSYSIPEIKIIGYQKGLSQNKLSKDDLIVDIIYEYYDKTNKTYYEIIDSMNDVELNYFSKKIADSSKKWNSRKLSLNKVKTFLGINNKSISNESISNESISNESISNELVLSRNDNNNHKEIDIQFFIFPFMDKSIFDDLLPIIKNNLNYMYYLFIAALFTLFLRKVTTDN